jgi:hypothetical protein
MNRQQIVVLSLVVVFAAALRLLFNYFEIWNFNPLVAMCLFAGVRFTDKKLAFLIPFTAMIVTDLIIGFHAQMFPVYLSYALITVVGVALSKRETIVNTLIASLFSSALFFLVTNVTFWYTDLQLYPNTFAGQIESYTAALPFYRNALVGDLMFTALLFGSWYLFAAKKPQLVKASA